MTFQLNTGFHDGKFEIETKTDNGSIIISNLWENEGTITTDAGEYNIGKFNPSREDSSPDRFLLGQIIRNGVMAHYEYLSDTDADSIAFEQPSEENREIWSKVRHLYDTHFPLQLQNFISFDDEEMSFRVYGRQIAGSGLKAGETVGKYIDTFEELTGRKTYFVKRDCGPMGADIYTFKIKLKETVKTEA